MINIHVARTKIGENMSSRLITSRLVTDISYTLIALRLTERDLIIQSHAKTTLQFSCSVMNGCICLPFFQKNISKMYFGESKQYSVLHVNQGGRNSIAISSLLNSLK